MKASAGLIAAALLLPACTSAGNAPQVNLKTQDTRVLCRMVLQETNPARRSEIADLIARRGADDERCQRLIAADNAIAASVLVAGTAAAVAASSDGYGGGYGGYSAYGVAWDQFYNEHYQLIWRCRDRANGQFVEDYRCAGKAMVDSTWPGWRRHV